jgi:hypothetical protein
MDLKVAHEGGFFSCCSVRLYYLILFFNKYKRLPEIFDTTGFYTWYKQNNSTDDITFNYFKHYNEIPYNITHKEDVDYHECYQYKNYKELDLNNLLLFVKKYYVPNDNIREIQKSIENKYNIDFDNTCVLFYRGNDKATEFKPPPFDSYLTHANKILKENPNIKFIVQSDETNFLNYMKSQPFSDRITIFYDEIRHMYKKNNTVDKINKEQNYDYSLKYLAITLIMSKCKYVVCNTGNCSIWIVFFRNNTDNIIQL